MASSVRTYQPKKRQRSKVHGFRARMKTRAGRNVLKARRARGRKVLSAYVSSEAEKTSSQAFPRRLRLGSNRNYRYVYRRGRSYAAGHLTLVYCRGRDLKIGFSVSKKVGNAVTRNRVRRWMREDIRRMQARLRRGRYIFIARPTAGECAHSVITEDVLTALGKAGMLKDDLACGD